MGSPCHDGLSDKPSDDGQASKRVTICPCRGCKAAYKQGREDGKATVHDCGQHSTACCTAGYNRGYMDGFNQAQAANRLLNEMYGVKQDANSVHH